MIASALARRYARALFELADEQHASTQVATDLKTLRAAWDASVELRDVLGNPGIATESRRAIVTELATRAGVAPIVKNLLAMLADRRRVQHLPEIIEAYGELAESRAGRVRAEVITPGAMPEAYFAELERTLEHVTGRKVSLVRKQDPTLIAGVVARVGDKVFDGSLKHRLGQLRDELTQG